MNENVEQEVDEDEGDDPDGDYNDMKHTRLVKYVRLNLSISYELNVKYYVEGLCTMWRRCLSKLTIQVISLCTPTAFQS